MASKKTGYERKISLAKTLTLTVPVRIPVHINTSTVFLPEQVLKLLNF
jgi:hypothetical protein